MEPTYRELKVLNRALYHAIEWVETSIDSETTELYRAKDGQYKNRVPRGFKTSVRAYEAELKRFQRLRDKVQAELREIRENKPEVADAEEDSIREQQGAGRASQREADDSGLGEDGHQRDSAGTTGNSAGGQLVAKQGE